MNDDILSRLLSSQSMAETMPPQTVAQVAQPAPVVQPTQQQQIPTLSDSERRQKEIAAREEERQRRARERLAERQNAPPQPVRNESSMESDSEGADFNPVYQGGYDINDLIDPARERAESRIGELDRKPISEWSRSDWGKMLVDVGGGFASAKDGQFSSGLSSATRGLTDHLGNIDKRAAQHDEKMRDRMEMLDDLMMKDGISQRRTGDDRAYDQMVRGEDREYRSNERQQDRLHDQYLYGQRREDALADRTDERRYAADLRQEERAYAQQAQAAANSREDAKALRDAAAKTGRDYASDYIKIASGINEAIVKEGGEPLPPEELADMVLPQLRQAYGIGGLGGASDASSLPVNRTLSSGGY